MQIIRNILSGKAGPSLVLSGTPREIQAAVVPHPMTNNQSQGLLHLTHTLVPAIGCCMWHGTALQNFSFERQSNSHCLQKMGRMLLSSPVFHGSGQMEKGKARGRQESIFLMQILPSSFTGFSKQAWHSITQLGKWNFLLNLWLYNQA